MITCLWGLAFAWALPVVFPSGNNLITTDEGVLVDWTLSDDFSKFEFSVCLGISCSIFLFYVVIFFVVRKAKNSLNTVLPGQTRDEFKILIQSFIIFMGLVMILLSAYSYVFFEIWMSQQMAFVIAYNFNDICTVIFYCMNPLLYIVFSTQIREMSLTFLKSNKILVQTDAVNGRNSENLKCSTKQSVKLSTL